MISYTSSWGLRGIAEASIVRPFFCFGNCPTITMKEIARCAGSGAGLGNCLGMVSNIFILCFSLLSISEWVPRFLVCLYFSFP